MKKKVFFVLLIVSILIGSSIGAFFSYLRDLPQIKQLETFQPKTITKIYSDHDKLIAEFFQENIPPYTHEELMDLKSIAEEKVSTCIIRGADQ